MHTAPQATGWTLHGTVKDGKTGEALAFVNIAAEGSSAGTISDINGRFSLHMQDGQEHISFSYVGYHKALVGTDTIDRRKPLMILLYPKVTELSEVVVHPGANPAVRIIRGAVVNKERNDPELLPAYRCRIYNKIRYRAAPDFAEKKAKDDKEREKFSRYMEDHHLLLMESFIRRSHVRRKPAQETIIATRVSGFKDPGFTVLATQFQPFAFYNDVITLLDKDYYNPISRNSWKQYLFVLKDSIILGADTTFILQFRPASGKSFEGLSGVLGIHSGSFALAFVQAAPAKADMNSIRIQQHYSRVDSFFFPDQLDFELRFDALGLYLTGHSYIDSVETGMDPGSIQLHHQNTLETDSAALMPPRYWKRRPVPLDAKDSNTYHYLDSLGAAENLDAKMRLVENLSYGALPVGVVNIMITHLWTYNMDEGNRLELGVMSNKRMSRRLKLAAFGAYGLQDYRWKYGASLDWHLKDNPHTGIGLSWQHDVIPAATVMDVEKTKTSGTEQQYSYYHRYMSMSDDYTVEARALMWRSLQLGLHATQRYRSDLDFINHTAGGRIPLTIVGLNVRIGIREQYTGYAGYEVRTGGKWPVLWLRLDQINYAELNPSLNNAYYRMWGRLYYRLPTRRLGTFEWVAEGGVVWPGADEEERFFIRGVNTGEVQLRVDNAFVTAEPYTYLHDRYACIFMTWSVHRFNTPTKYSRPLLMWHNNAGYGRQSNLLGSVPLPFADFRRGYFETGLTLRDLYRYPLMDAFFIGFGIGGFYHYGPGSAPAWQDNSALTLDLSASF